MDHKLEAIIREIYELEPDLRGRDAEVRTMVAELLAVRPRVVPDRTFVARLRTEVLGTPAVATRTVSKPRPAHRDVIWWSYRLAPIGVFAALTLALVGGPHAIYRDFWQTTPPSVDTTAQTDVAPDIDLNDDAHSSVSVYDAGQQGMAPAPGDVTMMKSSGTMDAAMSEEDVMTMTSPEGAMKIAATVGDRIEISDQRPGSIITIDTLAMSAPGHVRLFIYDGVAPRAIIATTPLVGEGEHRGVVVTLDRPVRVGEVIYAQVFTSDGDALFEPYQDLPLYDENGGFVSTVFMITDIR